VSTVVAGNASEAMVAPMVGSGGVWSQEVCCVLRFWEESGLSRREEGFTFHLVFKFYTLNTICEGNAAINYITLQHKKSSFVSTWTGHTLH
jgi:hypothetical protein